MPKNVPFNEILEYLTNPNKSLVQKGILSEK